MGIAIPEYYLSLKDLSLLRGVDPQKYLVGLGCENMALAPPQATVVPYMVAAVKRALERSPLPWERIGMVAVGSESGLDHSRPLSSFILEALGRAGRIQSFEVKHACYGGTVALLHAIYWIASGANEGKAALVVCGDLARYAPRHPGEPTQGGGAVAMIVGEGDEVAELSFKSYPYAEPAWDFYKPLEEPYPAVNGPLSLDCYIKAALECFGSFIKKRGAEALLEADALCFHVPYPKMVIKTMAALKERFSLSDEPWTIFLKEKVEPYMRYNRQIGNAYTASLWISVATALADLRPGSTILAFSYGSGFGSELLELRTGRKTSGSPWIQDLERDLNARVKITGEQYERWRDEELRLFSDARLKVLMPR